MLAYYTFNDKLLGHLSRFEVLPSVIAYTIPFGTDERIENPSYDEMYAKRVYVQYVKRDLRNMCIQMADELELKSYRNANGQLMTENQLNTIKEYKDALRNYPAHVIENDFQNISLPRCPSFAPQAFKEKLNAEKNKLKQKLNSNYFRRVLVREIIKLNTRSN